MGGDGEAAAVEGGGVVWVEGYDDVESRQAHVVVVPVCYGGGEGGLFGLGPQVCRMVDVPGWHDFGGWLERMR